MWENARVSVSTIFFKDKIELYKVNYLQSAIGESIESLELVGEYDCNIQNGQSNDNLAISGSSTPQTIRISTIKNIDLSYDFQYQIKIKSARIYFDENEIWKVSGWVESQISTVIMASREVAI